MQTQSAEGQFFKTYTGTKTIKAMPMDARRAKDAGATVPDKYFEVGHASYNPGAEGYLVEYPDGYRSWSPKKAFEDAYKVSETPLDRLKNELSDLVERIKETTEMRYDPQCDSRGEIHALDIQLGGMEQYADMLYRRIKYEQERHGGVAKERSKVAITCAGTADSGM